MYLFHCGGCTLLYALKKTNKKNQMYLFHCAGCALLYGIDRGGDPLHRRFAVYTYKIFFLYIIFSIETEHFALTPLHQRFAGCVYKIFFLYMIFSMHRN